MVMISKPNYWLTDAVVILRVFLSYWKLRPVHDSILRSVASYCVQSWSSWWHWRRFALKSSLVPQIVHLGLAGKCVNSYGIIHHSVNINVIYESVSNLSGLLIIMNTISRIYNTFHIRKIWETTNVVDIISSVYWRTITNAFVNTWGSCKCVML